MSDDGPNYSRNIVRRRQVLPVIVGGAFTNVVIGVWMLLNAVFGVPKAGDPSAYVTLVITMAVSFVAGAGAAAPAGIAFNRIHRSIWPEHPNDEG
jgi:hypothetical protein